MKIALLIPQTRNNSGHSLIQSAKGYDLVLTYTDEDRKGPNHSRNKLFDMALNDETITHVQYCDDDDLLIPGSLDSYKRLFSGDIIDLVYFPFYDDDGKGVFDFKKKPELSTDVITYCLGLNTCPINWVASVKGLSRVKDKFGSLWDETVQSGKTISFYSRAIMSGLSVAYSPVPGYKRFMDTDQNQQSKKVLSPEILGISATFENWLKDSGRYDKKYDSLFTNIYRGSRKKLMFGM